MSKERLEEMNKKVTGLTDSFGDFADVVQMDVDTYAWFYEQVERAQELEQEKHLAVQYNRILGNQNKRYREAIENTQVAIQKNLSRWNYKDEVVLHDVFIHNKKLLEDDSE